MRRLSNKNSGSKRENEGRPLNGESPSKKGKRVSNAQNESLRDSTIENLLNGQDLKDLGSGSKKAKQEIKKKLSTSLKKDGDTLDFDDDDEFDLDNSDDLNRFINKYESLIVSKEKSAEKNVKTPTSASKKSK